MSSPAQPPGPNTLEGSVGPHHAAAEFVVRITLASPLRTYVSASDLVEPLDVSMTMAGHLLGELAVSERSGLVLVDRRPGAKSRQKLRFDVQRGGERS